MNIYKEQFNGIFQFETKDTVLNVVESTASIIVDSSFSSKSKSICQLQLLQNEKETIVIASELSINTGMSITNAAEILAQNVITKFHLDPLKTRFIEHYGPESYDYDRKGHNYDDVVFIWENNIPREPKWNRLNLEEIQKIQSKIIISENKDNSSQAN